MHWRLIDSGPCEAAFNMALDEAIAISVREGSAAPTLRFYTWQKPSITIGCFQSIEEVNIEYCENADIPIVRRPTGGRAILHGYDLTYSFSSQNIPPFFSEGLLQTYSHLSRAFFNALTSLGIKVEMKSRKEKGRVLVGSPLCFQSVSYGEITLDGKKLIGSAQKRWREGFLQQGSIQLYLKPEKMIQVFADAKEENVRASMTGILHHSPETSEQQIKKAIILAFEKYFNVKLLPSDPTSQEMELAQKLIEQKYRSRDWTFSR